MDESYGTYVDDEYCDNHDYGDTDDDTDDDSDDYNDHKNDGYSQIACRRSCHKITNLEILESHRPHGLAHVRPICHSNMDLVRAWMSIL